MQKKPIYSGRISHPQADGWADESWREAAADYHRARGDRTLIVETDQGTADFLRSLDKLTPVAAQAAMVRRHLKGRAAASTVEALIYGLRERGTAALKETSTQARLRQLSKQQLGEVIARLISLRPNYPQISDDLLLLLEASREGQ